MATLRLTTTTYRLQFNSAFHFANARDLVPYLDALGITDIYASPLLKARPGSQHGYDVTDHSLLNPELGGEEAFEYFSEALRERNMGLIMDVVPNHMDIDDVSNRWWQDVLENGPSSPFASCFDIDWAPPKQGLAGCVLIPILGDQFGKVLENGEIHLCYESGKFYISYYEHRYPVDPHTSTVVLETVAEHVRITSEADDPDLIELESIVTSLKHLPPRTSDDPADLEERRRESQVARRRLVTLTESSSSVRRAIEGVVVDWSGRPGEPETFDRLETLLDQQAYRLCHWRVAADEINYRRFFDINNLAAIRVENPSVFAAVHEVILRLIGEGRVTGLRIDHPDGLYDPENYFLTLQGECRRVIPHDDPQRAILPASGSDYAIYVAAEKILSRNEELPLEWAVHGTSGYEMLNLINGLFVDPRGREPLERFYSQLCGGVADFEDLVYQCKRVILKVSMSSELHVLARRLDRVSEQHRWSRDFTLWSLHEALREIIACFPVYRTYVQVGTTDISDDERRQVETAVESAKRRNPHIDHSIFDFVQGILLLEEPDGLDDAQRAERREFVMKLQQLTGPVTAKGLEDTAFYRVYPLASLNEVGGEPDQFSVSLDEFHRQNTVRCARWPHGMVATSTHDTKRSEDARAWINVLSEIPDQWTDAVGRWRELNALHKAKSNGRQIPDANEEYLFYQTLVGVWPLTPPTDAEYSNFIQRIAAYMEKAIREAKVHTNWISPNLDYEVAVDRFVRHALVRGEDNGFTEQVERFRQQINLAGMCNALAQVLLKITVPGVPDIYQGCELWNFRLVDPDNRQPVNFQKRREALEQVCELAEQSRPSLVENLLRNWQDGWVKLYTTYMALQFRRRHAQLFQEGEYLVLDVGGQRDDYVCEFVRRSDSHAALVVVPRFSWSLTGGESVPLGTPVWEDTSLELPPELPATWHNIFTGEQHEVASGPPRGLSVGDVLNRFPIALLEAQIS